MRLSGKHSSGSTQFRSRPRQASFIKSRFLGRMLAGKLSRMMRREMSFFENPLVRSPRPNLPQLFQNGYYVLPKVGVLFCAWGAATRMTRRFFSVHSCFLFKGKNRGKIHPNKGCTNIQKRPGKKQVEVIFFSLVPFFWSPLFIFSDAVISPR